MWYAKFPIAANDVTIGQAAENDIALQSLSVSAHHARIDFDGAECWVTDLDSEHGTFLAGIKLLPQVRERWRTDQALRIGKDYELYIVEEERSATSEDVESARPSPPRPQVSVIGITSAETEFEVAPGANRAANVILRNQGLLVDHFKPSIVGVPDDWVTLSSDEVRLEPGDAQEIVIDLHPPRTPESSAGAYPLKLARGQQSRAR